MDIQLTQMEHGKPLALNSLMDDKKSKIKLLKAKKNYTQLYQFAVNLPPTKDKFLLKASALMHLKKWNQAIQSCQRGLDLQQDSQFYNIKGRACGKLGDMQEKVKLTQKAIQIDPTIPAYYRNLGAALYKLKDYDGAMENHSKAIELQPQNSLNYHNLGAASFRKQNYEKAKIQFSKAIQKNRKQPLSHSWLGDCYKKMGQLQKAVKCYTKAYEVSGKQFYKIERDKLEEKLNPKKGFFQKLFS